MKTLKELMVEEIKGYDWCDYAFKRGDNNAKSFVKYEDWLNSLSDDDFLWRYNDVKGVIDKLD